MKKEIYSSPFIHKDGSPLIVLDFKDKRGKPSSNMFMHVTVSSRWDSLERRRHQLILFECKQGRSIATLLEDIEINHFSGYLLTDGLKGYEHYDESRHCGCLVHAVRKFKEIAKSDKSNKAARDMIKFVADIHDIENMLRGELERGRLNESEFLEKRRARIEPLLDNIFDYVDSNRGYYAQKSATGKAFAYFAERKKQFYSFLDLIEGVPNNNVAELAIRPFALGKHNWLFCKSIDGADASAFFYSLIESAKLCGINPFDYIEAVCSLGPECSSEEEFESILPWNIDLSILDGIRERRMNTERDPERTEPYLLSGGNGC